MDSNLKDDLLDNSIKLADALIAATASLNDL